MSAVEPVGNLLREWRKRRRLSQLDLALDADISPRHLSFVETGRAQPSRDVVLSLADRLDVPLRERNILLTAAGYAPVYAERKIEDPALSSARAAVDLVLKGHEPYPAIAVNRHWELVAANNAIAPLMAGADPTLLEPPINVLRLSLHPQGIAPRIANLAEWRTHILSRLRQQVELTADPVLLALLEELTALPAPASPGPLPPMQDYGGVAIPLRFVTDAGILSFIGTTTIFGTPIDVTLSELAVESFFPADAETAAALRAMAGQ